jgi:hypothetical protein
MNTRIKILVFPLLLFPGFSVAFADTETRSVDTQVVIAASPGDVLQAFLSDDDLKAWWKVSRSLVEPDMPILGPMQLDIAVSPTKSGTLLRLSHRGYRYGGHWDSMYDMVVKGWDHVLGDMAAWFQEEY